MVNYRDAARVVNILKHCKSVQKCLKKINYSFDMFQDDDVYQNAILYPVLQIGENVYNLSPEFKKEYNKIPWNEIVKMRHIAVHHYYKINLTKVWNTCVDDLPILKEYIEHIIEENNIDTGYETVKISGLFR